MRRAVAVGVLAMAVGAAACSCGTPCGGCGPSQACDPATSKCVASLAYGAACADDGGLACPQGSSCQSASGTAVCAETCNPAALPTTCPTPQQCWQVLDDGGAPVLAAQGIGLGYCATVAGAGQLCGLEGLSFCDPSLACVFFVSGAANGVCFQPCTPQSPQCQQSDEQCLAVFVDPTQGICALPQAPDAGCFQAEGLFCPTGQVCLDPGDGGSCFGRCTPGTNGGCAAPQSCLAPTTDPTVGICAQTAPLGGVCDPPAAQFCDSQSECIIDPDGGATCHLDCSPSQPVCPQGQSCLPISGTALYACG